MGFSSMQKRERRRNPRLSERLFRCFVYKYFARNLVVDLQLQAKRQTLDYINE